MTQNYIKLHMNQGLLHSLRDKFEQLVILAIAIFLPLAIAFTNIPAAQAFDAPEFLKLRTVKLY